MEMFGLSPSDPVQVSSTNVKMANLLKAPLHISLFNSKKKIFKGYNHNLVISHD